VIVVIILIIVMGTAGCRKSARLAIEGLMAFMAISIAAQPIGSVRMVFSHNRKPPQAGFSPCPDQNR
jgi:hypothetical protein